MSIDRTTIRKGPANLTLGGGTFFAESGITLNLNMEKETRSVDSFGAIKDLVVGKTVELTFTPVSWANLSVLFPYASTKVGEDVFGSTDSALVITPINGEPITLSNAAVTSLPDILLSASGSQFGEVTITALIANSSDADALASYIAFGIEARGASLTGLDITKILNAAYTASYNGATYHSAEGFTISFDLTLSENRVDGLGIVGMAFQDLRATCSFIPVAGAASTIASLVGFATAVGAEPTRYDLTVAGGNSGDPSVILQDCVVNPGGYTFGNDSLRNQALTWQTARRQTTGANDALFTVGNVV